MNTQQIAQQAREMVANGQAPNIERAIVAATRESLDQTAGPNGYTVQAENAHIRDVRRVEQSTR